MLKLTAILICGLIFIGHSEEEAYFNPKYSGRIFPDRTLNILPIASDDLESFSLEEFKDDFKIECSSDCYDMVADTNTFFLHKYLTKVTDPQKIKIEPLVVKKPTFENTDYFNFKATSKNKGGEEEFVFRLPNKEAIIRNKLKAEFLIIFSNLKMGRSDKAAPGILHILNSSGVNPARAANNSMDNSFTLNAKYIIWNYKENEPVTWGVVSSSSSANLYISRGDWISNCKGAIKKLLTNTPFYRNVRKKR